MLLIIEAFLLISAAVGQDHRTAAEGQIYPLDMAENSVDDQFYWCLKKMEHRVQTEFLKKEMSSNYEFEHAWKVAEKNHTSPGDNLSKNHSVAIYVYTNSAFNKYTGYNLYKQKYKDGTYSWYSLHFWLTEAIQILKKTQTKCYNTHRGTEVEFDKNVKGKEVRFGQFASSSLDRTKAQGFGNKSCFEIYTCYGADVTKYSRFHEEKEVLIPPYETFTVSDVKQRSDHADLWCGTVFTLKSYTTRSFLNCAVANSGNQVAFFNALFILIIFCSVVSY
ncbi:hypothetical protein PO909_000737 [Leuciscus waleckii]